jgi:hypothetical protein
VKRARRQISDVRHGRSNVSLDLPRALSDW